MSTQPSQPNMPETPKTNREIYGLRHEPEYFRNLGNARSYAARGKCSVVMLGDDERFWVVCLADAARLERAGLEWA